MPPRDAPHRRLSARQDVAVDTVVHAHEGVAVVLSALRLAAGNVTLDPDPSNLPGGAVLQHLTNGLGGWALILALAGLLIGAAAWALGAHAQNYHQAFNGRRTVLVSGLAALLIGAAPALINFFFHAGQGVH